MFIKKKKYEELVTERDRARDLAKRACDTNDALIKLSKQVINTLEARENEIEELKKSLNPEQSMGAES